MSGNELLPYMRGLAWDFRIYLSDELMNKINFCWFLSGELFFPICLCDFFQLG